ncbi:hypothetical protein, partial [Deinococcus detaillensis]|uniref:hypothetical protein n=1 Tax=Deinococcus detaillensis TaxID=2592048 RepID=UPI00163D903B
HPPTFAFAAPVAPAPAVDAESAQRVLWPLAHGTTIGGIDPQWLFYEGDPPPGTAAHIWSLEAFAAQQHAPQWAALASALRGQFPQGVKVYQLARPEGSLYLVLGNASWGSGGFIGNVKR